MKHLLMGIAILLGLWARTGTAQDVLDDLLNPAHLPFLKASKLVQVSSYDTTGGNNDRLNIPAGERAVLAELDGPGVITRIWLTISSPDQYFLRRILLRIYWDGEKSPSVEVPIGDFFGTGFGYRHYLSYFLGMSSGGYYCYFPMPFRQSARLEVVNETGQEIYAFYYHIDYQKLESPLPPEVAYFHAQWRRELRTPPERNYTVLEARGEGHLVGVNLNVQSYEKNLYFLEGDEMIYVDGERFPSIYGTGTEDYFTSGWYFNRGEFAGLFHGLILKDDSLGRIAAYRFHVGDAIPFKKSLRFTIEHGHGNEVVADYSSTAYWYQKEPHAPFPPMLPALLRIPLRVAVPNGALEAESLIPQGEHIQYLVEDMRPYGPDWSGLQQLRIEPAHQGARWELVVEGLEEPAYHVFLYLTKGPDYGNLAILSEGRRLATVEGYHEQVIPGGAVRLDSLPAPEGRLSLQFESVGKAARSRGLAAGLDALVLEPVRHFITRWNLIGPFPNPRRSETERLGLDIVYPPEQELDFQATYIGADSQQVRWQVVRAGPNGRVNLWNRFQPYELVVAYAQVFIYAPEARRVPLLLGSDDGVKVFLNGQPVHRKLLVRISAPDQDRVWLNLKPGWNSLLLKIENNFGGYAFFARVIDPEGTLRFALRKP